MADSDVASSAFERAWSVYLLLNRNVDVHDERRSTLQRFINKRFASGENDPECLTVEGLIYLKKLDGLGGCSFR